MGKRAWLVFAIVQTIGCTLAGYGTVYSESAFVRGSWLIGFLLLLPGNLPAMAVGQTLIHFRTAYIFFPVTLASNLWLWLMWSRLWRTLRRTAPENSQHTYTIAFTAMGLIFIVANTLHFLRPVTCADCFFRYGLPFTLYREDGFAGGGGFVWGGLIADVACVVAVALLFGRIWELFAGRQISR